MIDILRLPQYLFKPYLIIRSGREVYLYRQRGGRSLRVHVYEDPSAQPRYHLDGTAIKRWSLPAGLTVSPEEKALIIERMRGHFGGNMALVADEQ